MQKDKAEKFYLTKRKLQMRKTAKITDYFREIGTVCEKSNRRPKKTAAILKKKNTKRISCF